MSSLIKTIIVPLLTFMLCMGVFYCPTRAANVSPPSVVAWINGNLLLVEVRGGQMGIDAVYINDNRVNYRVDEKLELPVEVYAGTGQYISIYSVDFMGNNSQTVNILNPFYIPAPVAQLPPTAPPTVSPTPVPTSQPTPIPTLTQISQPTLTPTPQPTPEPTQTPTTELTPTPTATPAYTVVHTPIEAAVTPSPAPSLEPVPVSQPRPFTPDGEGEVLDNVTENDGKEFLTITTEDGNVFYLILDRQRNGDNVYLLNTVTEQDLIALAEKTGNTLSTGISAIPSAEPSSAPESPPPVATSTPPPTAAPASNNSMYVLLAVVVLGVGGAGYYFKIVRGKKSAPDAGETEYEDEYGYNDETEDSEKEQDDEELSL